MIELLKEKYGLKCTGIKINLENTDIKSIHKPIRFCEAVNYSFNTPVAVESKYLSCLGSKRSFGLLNNNRSLIEHIAVESNISLHIIEQIINDIPKFNIGIKSFILGIDQDMEKEVKPDVYIIQIKPHAVMDLIRLYLSKTNKIPIINSYTFLSVCGNIFVQSYKFNKMSISFGCPESRKYAGIDENSVIVGMPYKVCKKVFLN